MVVLKRTGLSTTRTARKASEEIAALGRESDTNTRSRSFDPALRRMTRRISQAATESGPAVNGLKMLNLEADKLAKMGAEKQLYAVADAMKDIPDQAELLRIAFSLFDTDGGPMVNMLEQGAQAIREAQLEAEKFNQIISQADAEPVGRLNSEFSKMGAQLEGIKTQAMIGVLPMVEDLSSGLGVLANNFDAVSKVAGGAALVALSRYSGGLLETRVATVKSAIEKRNAARAELELARAQKLQTAETLRQTLAMNAQNVTRTQTQTAIQADIAACNRLAAAEANMTKSMTASTAALGLA